MKWYFSQFELDSSPYISKEPILSDETLIKIISTSREIIDEDL